MIKEKEPTKIGSFFYKINKDELLVHKAFDTALWRFLKFFFY